MHHPSTLLAVHVNIIHHTECEDTFLSIEAERIVRIISEHVVSIYNKHITVTCLRVYTCIDDIE